MTGLMPRCVRRFHERVANLLRAGKQEMPHDLCVIFVCKGESHRSVGIRHLYQQWISNNWTKYASAEDPILVCGPPRRGAYKCNNCSLRAHREKGVAERVCEIQPDFDNFMQKCDKETQRKYRVAEPYCLRKPEEQKTSTPMQPEPAPKKSPKPPEEPPPGRQPEVADDVTKKSPKPP